MLKTCLFGYLTDWWIGREFFYPRGLLTLHTLAWNPNPVQTHVQCMYSFVSCNCHYNTALLISTLSMFCAQDLLVWISGWLMNRPRIFYPRGPLTLHAAHEVKYDREKSMWRPQCHRPKFQTPQFARSNSTLHKSYQSVHKSVNEALWLATCKKVCLWHDQAQMTKNGPKQCSWR